jgi:hypothetical protein
MDCKQKKPVQAKLGKSKNKKKAEEESKTKILSKNKVV